MSFIDDSIKRLREEEKERRKREQAAQLIRGPQSSSNSNSTNSSTSSQNSSQTAQTGSQGTPAERALFKMTGRRHTVTDRRRGIDKNEKTQNTTNVSGQNRGLSGDDNDRFSNTVKGAGKQWLGGQLSGVGTYLQDKESIARGYNNLKAEDERPQYSLRSRDEAEKTNASRIRDARLKEGVDKSKAERDFTIDPNTFTQKTLRKGDSLIESGTADIEKAKEGANGFEKFLIDNGSQMLQWAGDAGLRAIPVVGQALSIASFMNRAGGMSAYQGRQEGMNAQQQYNYQMASALMEGISELTFQSIGALRYTYGKGAFSLADKMTNKVASGGIVQRLMKTEVGKSLVGNMARLGGGAIEEGLEEVETDLVEPVMKYLIKKSEDPMAEFEGWDLRQMGYDFLMGATMGGVLGSADVARGVSQDLRIVNSDAYNDGLATSLIKQASVQGRADSNGRILPTNAEILAQQMQTQLDEGKRIEPIQIRMLQEAIGQSTMENDEQFTRKMTQEYDKAQKSGDLVQMEGTRLESQGIDNASTKLVNDAVEKARQVIGENATQEDAEAVAGVTTGIASSTEIDTVLAKPELKKAVETIVNEGADAESAVSIPINNAEARDVLENLTAVKRIANRNTILKDVQAKNAEIIKSSVDTMSEGGKNLFASRAEFAQDTIGGNRDRNLEIYRDRFSRLYTDGNTKGADFETSYKRIIGSLDSEALKSVFTEDFARQIFEEGRNAIITNTAKETAKSKAEEYANRKGGLTFENDNENLISARAKEVLQKFAERVGVEIHIVKSLSKDASGKALMSRTGKKLVVNGKYQDGVITIASDAQNKLITVAKHELTHHLKETSPEMYQKLEDFVFERWYHGNAEEMEDEIARYTKLYSGQGLDRDGIREEIIADASEAFFTDEGAIQDAISFSEKLGRAIHDGIKTMLDAFLGLQDADSRRMRGYGGFLKDLGILQEAERMWLEALEDTQQRKRNARGNATAEDYVDASTQYTTSDEKHSLVESDDEIERLNSEPTQKSYRAMALIDGKLYPPMATKVKDENGKWVLQQGADIGQWLKSDITTDPKMFNSKGQFILKKDNDDTIPASYNPYIHSSDTMLNDQFATAYKRPNIVVVEGEIPTSELTNGKRAEHDLDDGRHIKAKDPTGTVQWKAGVVQSDLTGTRTVFLTNHFKPTRVVPDSEVARSIQKMVAGTDVVIPYNVVTPRLRQELLKLGVKMEQSKQKGYQVDLNAKYSVTAEEDQAYMDAVNRGDMETAQRMVDEQAKKNGYDIKAYHGTGQKFTKFDRSKQGSNFDGYLQYGNGFYFATSEKGAKAWGNFGKQYGGDNVMSVYLKADRMLDITQEAPDWAKQYLIENGYSEYEATFATSNSDRFLKTLLEGLHMSNQEVQDLLISKGYDGIKELYRYGTGQLVVFYPVQIKSADAVTYNDDGEVIPLSKRFTELTDDIRYSVTEDSDGNKLSEGQREYFGNSKIVDSKGNLKVMYHGSPNDFDTFDIKRAKSGLYGRGFYFTDSKGNASLYGKTYGVYLDIETPLQTGTHDITRSQLKNFIKVLAEDEDYGIENYGYGATVDSVLKSIWGKDDFAMLQDLNATAVGDFAEAVKLFNKVNGTSYDGIVAPTETIAFYPEQIKETSNKKPTKSPNIKFSVTEPVEETKDLIAVHNLKAEDLRGALDLGGFPMPSIAIIKADAGHNAYGEYSAVFDKSTIDPSVTKRNVVYGGDAWTPTFPRMQYKANDRVSKKISQLYYDRSRDLGYEVMKPLQKLANEPNDELDSVGGEAELKEAYKKNEKMMRMFLRMNNNDVEDVVNRTEDTLNDVEIRRRQHFIDALGEDAIREFEGKNVPNGSEKAKHRIEWAKLHKAEIENAYADYMKKEYDFTDEDAKEVLADTKFIELMNFIRDAMNYLNNGATTVRESIDQDATDKAVEQRAKAEGYDKWVDDLLNGIEEKRGIRNNKDMFTPSGNRRSWEALHDEPTLLTIVQIMSAQENGETFLGSSLKAVAQKQYRNISEVRADKGRLKTISEEEYKTLMDGFAERENDIITRIDNASPTYESNPFIRHSDIRSSIVDNVRRGLSKTAFLKDLQKYANTKGATAKDVDDIFDLVRDVANIPTGYFEAKPKRPVTFYEVRALLAPSDAPTDLISRLQDEGVNVVQYEAGNDEDRIAKLNQASEENNLKFSVSDDEVLDRYIVDRQKRIDDGEQMSFFGSLNETLPSKPKEKTRSEKFYDNVLKTIANIKKKGSWSGFEVKGLFLQYPEFNFIERLNNKADETAVSDFNAFLSSFDKIDDLRYYNWFFSAYENSSLWKKTNRSGKMKFNKLIENRIEEIMAGKAHGRNVGIEKRDYTPTEMRKLFNELNTDKELEELGKKVFDCIDKNFDVKFQGVANIEGFKHGQGGTLGQAGGRTVHLNMKYLNSEGYTDQQKASTILHESIHVVTVYALRNRNNYTMPKNIQDACDVIEDVFWQIKDDPMFKGEYGVSKGAEEMVAELSNPIFREKLRRKNVFARVIEAIRNILGIEVEVGDRPNAFKEVNKALETLMSNADVVSFERYANKVSRDYNGKFSVSEEDENAPTPKEYQSTIAKLEEKVADLKSEFKRTDLKTADPKQTRIQAGRLLKRHDSNLTLQGDVVDAFGKIHRLYKEKGFDAFDEASQIALETAKQVVNGIAIIHDEGMEQQKEIREFLKNNKIIISPYIEKNMDDFASFRKKNAFRLKLKKGEVSNLDKYIYPRLQELFPTAFPDEYYKANNKEGGENTDVLVDMLRHIGDVLDNPMYTVETITESTPEWKEYVSDIASDIMETAYGLQTKKTFADKKYLEKQKAVQEAYRKAREEALASRDRALTKQAERYETKISYLKQRNKDFKEETRERAEKNRRIAQIAGIHKRLLEKLNSPSDTKHLPDGYAPIVSKVLSMFDFTTSGMDKWAEKNGEPSKRYKYLSELQKQLTKMAKDESSEIEVDPDLIDLVEELTADIEEYERLSDMDSAKLEDIATLFRAFEHQINSYNKAFDENNKKRVSENAEKMVKEIGEAKHGKWRTGIMGRVFTSNLNPSDFFELMGGTVEEMYDSVRKGFDKYEKNLSKAKNYMQSMVTPKQADKWMSHKATYKTSGGEIITLTDTQLMSLYCLAKREQAQGHIYGQGGVVSAPVKVKKGLKAETLNKARVNPTVEDVTDWVSKLSKEQREVADSIQQFFVDEISEWGNETSMKLYGYKKFTEKNYFPIQSSRDFLASNFDAKGNDPTLKNISPTRALVKEANNPIMLDDIFSVFAKHTAQMASYNAYVPAITDFQRVWNYKIEMPNGRIETVQERFGNAYGDKITNYVKQFYMDMNGVYKKNLDITTPDKLLGAFKKSAVGGNLRVLFQQPMAIARAGLIINPVYLTASVPKTTVQAKKVYNEMLEHCPIAEWKTWGFYSMDITGASRDLKNVMIGKDSVTDKVFMNMYGVADNITWTVIFNACKMQVEAQNKGIKKGSDEYWEKVNDLASRVFDRTQVVDSPFHRSELMKSQDAGAKYITMFMAEPTKTLNMINTELTKVGRAISNKEFGKATAGLTRVTAVMIANAMLLAVGQSLIDAMRSAGGGDDDDDKGDLWERFQKHWITNTKDNLNIANMLPFVKDIFSLANGYSVTRPDMAGVEKLVKAVNNVKKYYEKGEEATYTEAQVWTNLALQATYVMGVPLANAKRDLEAMYLTGAELTNDPNAMLYALKFKYQVNSNTKRYFVDAYYDALERGNRSLARNIYRYLIKNGVTDEYIEKRKEKWEEHRYGTDDE